MAKAKKAKVTRGEGTDVDDLFIRSGFEPPKINLRRAIEHATKSGKSKLDIFSYAQAAELLHLKNSNNIAKWFKNENLNFTTLKMIMYVLNCSLDDIVDSPKKIPGDARAWAKIANRRLAKK